MNNFLKTLLVSLSLFVLTITYSKAWVMDVWTIEGMDAQELSDATAAYKEKAMAGGAKMVNIRSSSKLRGDIKWQKNALQSDKSKFMIFYEDRPLIKTDPTNRDNPKIYWLSYQDVKYLLNQKVITIFLGVVSKFFSFKAFFFISIQK